MLLQGTASGGYGVVSFGTYRRKSVVKKDFKYMNTIVERIYNYREVYTLATCNHPNIVKFIGAGPNTRIADVRYVVIERATDTSLDEREHLICLGANSTSSTFSHLFGS